MARVITGIFGNSGPAAPPAAALRITTALQGVPIPWLLGGQQRLPLNLIDYFDLFAAPLQTPGGKGGVGGSGTKGAGGQYFYSVSFIGGICEGPDIESTGQIFFNGTPIFTSVQALAPDHLSGKVVVPGAGNGGQNAPVNFEVFTGDYAQPIWGYLIAAATGTLVIGGYQLPGLAFGTLRELAYRGCCYIGFENFPLGPSPTLPQITLEVRSTNSGVNGQLDGDPSVCVGKFLTDPFRGVGFPSARLGDLSVYSNYAICFGLLVSPIVISGVTASSFLDELTKATNVAPCWQDGFLTFAPYGDQAQTAGQVVNVTETHQVPPANTAANLLAAPLIQVANFATFAGDLGVTYLNAVPLTPVTLFSPSGVPPYGSPLQGQYYYGGNGTYYFNRNDVSQGVLISYSYAATASYLPSTQSVYDFTLDDFLPNKGTLGHGHAAANDPVAIVRKSRDEMLNNVRVEYLDRANNYNPVLLERKDEASIVQFGRMRPSEVRSGHFFCLGSAAQQSASLQLAREQIARKFQWTVGRHFMLILELMMVCTLTNAGQGLTRQSVRVTEFKENDDSSITITAEEYPGTLSAPLYGQQASSGYQTNYNVAPGSANAPIFFEPDEQLGGGLFIWAGISGSNPNWGGCAVWLSNDGVNYSRLPQLQQSRTRMGALSASVPAVNQNPNGQTIDATNAVAVNLAESLGILSSGTITDATNLNNAVMVGTEVMSYETATLTSTYNYSLSYLVRAAYGTNVSAHLAGEAFMRLDENVFKFPYNAAQIGKTIYVKLQSFNIFEGGLQSLADVHPYTYVIQGTALASPLPQVANVRTVYNAQAGYTEIWWDEISDFRTVRYEIRTGASSAAAALTLGTVAHPPFRVPGDATYWIAGVTTPGQGITVYSSTWSSVAISGAVITQNIVLTYDLKANGWPGIFLGGAGVDNGLNAIRTGTGNILSDADMLGTADVLNFGGATSGQYFPAGVYVDIGYTAQAAVNIIYEPTGIPIGQNILTVGNILTDADVLGSAATQFISVFPLIHTSTSPGGDLYALGNLYQYPDLYAAGSVNWNPWQKFSPGIYQTRFLDFYMELDTSDPGTLAYDLTFTITVTIPARIDTYSLTTSAGGATTVTFAPTGQSSAAFNGGPASGNLPAVQGTIINATAGDDLFITSLGLSSLQVSVKNAGSFVARSIILTVEGF